MSNLNVLVFVASLGFLWYPMTTVDHGGKGATMQLYYLKRWFSFREMLNLRRDSSWFICSIMILTPTLQFIWGELGYKMNICPATRSTADSQSHVDVPIQPQHPRHWENPTKRWLATVDQPSRRACWQYWKSVFVMTVILPWKGHEMERTWSIEIMTWKGCKNAGDMIWNEEGFFHPVHSPRKEVWGFSCDR